jgi:hypothetical protein
MTLYLSFTLVSLFETLAFALSRHVRRDTDRYLIVLEERRNPRILTPTLVSWIAKVFRNLWHQLVRKLK